MSSYAGIGKDDEIKQLKAQVESLTKQNNDLNAVKSKQAKQVRSKNKQIADLNAAKTKQTEQIAAKDKQIEKLKDEHTTEMQAKSKEIDELKARENENNATVDDLIAQSNKINDQLQNKDKQIEELKTKLEGTSHQLVEKNEMNTPSSNLEEVLHERKKMTDELRSSNDKVIINFHSNIVNDYKPKSQQDITSSFDDWVFVKDSND